MLRRVRTELDWEFLPLRAFTLPAHYSSLVGAVAFEVCPEIWLAEEARSTAAEGDGKAVKSKTTWPQVLVMRLITPIPIRFIAKPALAYNKSRYQEWTGNTQTRD